MTSGDNNNGWYLNNGTYDPTSTSIARAPLSGSYDVVADQTGPGLSLLSESIALPSLITSATFSWLDRIENWYSSYNAAQRFSVFIVDNSSIAHLIFTTVPGDPLMQLGPNARSFDVTGLAQSLAGQTINLRFENVTSLFYNTVAIDNISLVVNASTVPESGATIWLLAGALGLLVLGQRFRR